MKKVIVIVGPTASGKTKNSIKVAKAVNGEVINGDSVQVYKELNIGSAKITEAEKDGIKHHLFDLLSAKDNYTVFDYQKDARAKINEIDVPIIVGGTGLYIKAALYNYEFNKEEKNEDKLYEHLTNEDLYQGIIKIDSKIDIDKNNRVRLLRAYHLAQSGDLRSLKNKKDEPLYDILTIYLDIDRKVLKEILVDRLDIMFSNGLIAEVESLRKDNITLNTIGYREVNSYLNNELSLEEAKELIISKSVKLAKRQKTWFMNQMNAVAIDPLDDNCSDKIIELTKEFLKEG